MILSWNGRQNVLYYITKCHEMMTFHQTSTHVLTCPLRYLHTMMASLCDVYGHLPHDDKTPGTVHTGYATRNTADTCHRRHLQDGCPAQTVSSGYQDETFTGEDFRSTQTCGFVATGDAVQRSFDMPLKYVQCFQTLAGQITIDCRADEGTRLLY